MPTFTPTGHPDFIPTNSTPIPVPVGQSLNVPVGTWGPITLTVTSGGAYAIAIQAHTPANIMLSDVTVQHIDYNGVVVFTEFFGAVPSGGVGSLFLNLAAPTLIRGNIYGSQLKISGQVANTAYVQTLFTALSPGASAADIFFYTLPNGIGDPDPKLSNGGATLPNFANPTPGNILASFVSFAAAFGTNTGHVCCVPYTGPAVLHLQQQGVSTTPINLRCILQGWTVAGGATIPIWQQTYATTAIVVGEDFDVVIPACLTTIEINNTDGAQNATVNCNLTGNRAA